MTAATPPPAPRRSHTVRNLSVAVVAVVAIAAVVGGGYGFWYLFLKSGPPGVDAAPPALPSQGVPAPASMDGTWNVNTSLGSMSDFTASWAGYRVQEQLASIGANTAVGRTPQVSGSMTLSGTVVSNVEITADLTALKSDEAARDFELTTRAIDTSAFPSATFKSTEPIDLGSLPADGRVVKVTARGDFTLHGVTRPVSIDLQAVRQGGVIALTGSMNVQFADYGFQSPTSFAVVSVQDHGIMELHLLFTHA
jgi:polyisoprenoid-binding protein YceI